MRQTPANAHTLVQQAVKNGKLPKLDGSINCVDCGEPATAYDHRDYTKPLDVEAVCQACNLKRGKGESEHATVALRTTKAFVERCKAAAALEHRSMSNFIIKTVTEALNR